MLAKEDFLADFRLGQPLTVVLGNGSLVWSGELIEIGERRIRLKMNDGTLRSVGYDGILAGYTPTEESAEEENVDIAAGEADEENLSLLREGVFAVRDAAYEWEFDPAALKAQIRLSPNTEQKRMVVALADNLADAEQTEDYETIDKIVAAGLALVEKEPENAVLRRLVGEAALLAEDFETAEESLYSAGNYGEAFYAAWMMESRDKMAEDGACHLLYEKKKNTELVEMFVRLAADAGDLSVFGQFLENEEEEYADLIGCCLAYLLARKKIYPELSDQSLSSPENFKLMSRLFRENYPSPENSQLEQMEQVDEDGEFPASSMVTLNSAQLTDTDSASPEQPVRKDIPGTIFFYKPEQKIGFIRAEDTDWFFHVNHITDPELEPMLEEDPEGQYFVLFDVGYNSRGSCANNVRLRDKEHPKEAKDPELTCEHHGVITRYYPFYSNGQITEGDTAYNFRLAFVSDPELHDYCELYQDVPQHRFEVIFRLKKLKDGKLVATAVRLARPIAEQLADEKKEEETESPSAYSFALPIPPVPELKPESNDEKTEQPTES